MHYLAASYAYGFIKNHCFVDGNKRVVFVVACVFLSGFNIWIDSNLSEKAEAAELFLNVASRRDATQEEAIARLEA